MSEDSEPTMMHAKTVNWAAGLSVQDGMNLIQFLEMLATCPIEPINKHAKDFRKLLAKSLEQTCDLYAQKNFPDAVGAMLLSPDELEAATGKLDEIIKGKKK